MSNVKPSIYGNFHDSPSLPIVDSQATFATAPPILPNELPPPYSPSQYGAVSTSNSSPVLATTYPPAVPSIYEVSCMFCHNRFVLNTVTNPLGRCLHCHRSSNIAIYSRHLKYRYLVSSIMTLVMGIIIMVFIRQGFDDMQVLILIPIVLFILSAACFCRFVYLCLRKSDAVDTLM